MSSSVAMDTTASSSNGAQDGTNGAKIVAPLPSPSPGVFIKKSAAKIPAPMPGGTVPASPSPSPAKMVASVTYEMPTGWKAIERNIYVNRAEVKLRPHQMPRCSCSGEMRCRASECENALVFIECSPERCNLGNQCQNQKFQRRQYAGIRPQRSGNKGWGIFATLPISQGQFVIEYVGEVIDADELEARSKACANDPHYYFLSLTGGETIDASKKGNVSRFINHSCDPNCVTQKWQINGESRVGIFALRSIKVGEELTFDYQFERFSQKKQRCLCGAANCSKYLGSKPKPKDGEKRAKVEKKKEKVVYSEISEAILPDEHVVLLLEEQPVDNFPFAPIDEKWYWLPESDIPMESDTEVEESSSSSSESSDDDYDSDGGLTVASKDTAATINEVDSDVESGEKPRKIAKLAEHTDPQSSEMQAASSSSAPVGSGTEAKGSTPNGNGMNGVDSPVTTSSVVSKNGAAPDSDSSTSEHPQHPAREFVNKWAGGGAPLFRRVSAHQQRLKLLDSYTDLLYDTIDAHKEKKTLMQDAELTAVSTLLGVESGGDQSWMAQLDIKQLMRDGLLEFSPRGEGERASKRTRSRK